jgi:deoxyribodipyrimidine photo-lyase
MAQPDSEGKQTFIKELCWRDFYNMIYNEYPQQKRRKLKRIFNN